MSFLYSIFLIVLSFAGILITAGIKEFKNWQLGQERIKQIKRENTAKYDTRRPILYLRSFTIDGTKIYKQKPDIYTKVRLQKDLIPTISDFHLNNEVNLAKQFEEIGPFIAIGDSKQRNIDQFGATRSYHSDAEWKIAVNDLMIQSSMIFFQLTFPLTRSLGWEIQQVYTRYLHKTVFNVKVKNEREYSSIKQYFEQIKLIFPEFKDLQNGNYITFNEKNEFRVNYSITSTLIYMKIKLDVRIHHLNNEKYEMNWAKRLVNQIIDQIP